jgi:endoglucanase
MELVHAPLPEFLRTLTHNPHTMRWIALALLLLRGAETTQAQADPGATRIRLNQVGYLPTGPKLAVVTDGSASEFSIVRATGGATVLRGRLSPPKVWAMSGETARLADFTRLTAPGRYVVNVPGVGRSYPFEIGPNVVRGVAAAALKGFYYQRVSTPLSPEHAGTWSRPAGHPDTSVEVHTSAAGPGRPAGTRISSPGGWYDAGDYNKYIVNSGITTYTLLLIADQFPEYAGALTTNIPESGNALPDVLDEALYNIRWMQTMQDPADGGVYHKLTNASFDGFVMPHEAVATRYVVQKGNAAALNFSAVMAHASTMVRRYPRELPGLADSLLTGAVAAWNWARRYPDSTYSQSRINETHTPKIVTGGYEDRSVADERRWAAAELFLATRQDSFLVAYPTVSDSAPGVPTWNSVAALAYFSLLERRRELGRAADSTSLAKGLLALANSLRTDADTSAYAVPMVRRSDFAWGSSAVAANQGIVLVQAYRLTRDTSYLRAAVSTLDYVLGRNGTGYSFLTGFGSKRVMFPHHRPSGADGIVAPVPGLLSGGPNPQQQDRCAGYPSQLPALSFADVQCSYASNEIAINWNAPLAYLAAAIDASYRERAGPRRR